MFSYLHLNDWAYIRFCSPISERVEFHVLIYDLMWSLYPVLSFCCHHFLLYIWKSLLPLCPNYILLLEWKSPDFLFRNAPSIRIPQPKIRSLLVCDQFSPSTFLASALLHLFVYNFMCRTWSNNVTMQWREMVLGKSWSHANMVILNCKQHESTQFKNCVSSTSVQIVYFWM